VNDKLVNQMLTMAGINLPNVNQRTLRHLRELSELMIALAGDVIKCDTALKVAPEDHFWRRSYVKSVFSYIEGNVYFMQSIVPELKSTLTRKDKMLIQGKNENGQYLRFLQNVKATLTLVATTRGLPPPNNYDPLAKAIPVRNRLTHPKKAQQLQVGRSELRDAKNAFLWFNGRLLELWPRSVSTVQPRITD
jgi:hypothetical protein